jgi:DNA-binding winged helix-turn-helix (wHTH) protein/TolB-like protein
MIAEEELRHGFKLGEWEVLPLKGVLRKGGQEEKPEPRVFGVLLALAQRDGDLVTRDELVDELWDGRPTSDEPINRCLSQLRGHLGDKSRPHRYVETLTRRGYRLLQPVELLMPAEPATSPAEVAAPPVSSRWNVVAATLLVAAIGWAAWTLFPTEDLDCIAVAPFENASADAASDYLVMGFKDELVHTLFRVPGLDVRSAATTSSSPNQDPMDLARNSGCGTLLTGRVQRAGNTLQIFYSLVRWRTGDIIATGEIEGDVQEIFALQEELATLVRDDLLGESSQQLITRTRPANFAAYDRFMRGLYAFDKRQDSGSSLEQAIEYFQETIRRDENFGPAYVMLATAYALMPTYRDVPDSEIYRLAIETAENGIAVDASVQGAANAVFGFVNHKEMNWLESEDAYKAAIAADIVDPNAFNWYSRMLASVGRLDDSLVQAQKAVELDPTSAVFNSRVALAYLWLGDAENAADYFDRANEYGASGSTHLMGYALYLYQQGRIEEAYGVSEVAADLANGSRDWIDPVFAALQDPAMQPQALEAINAAADADTVNKQVEFIVRTVLGDLDGALEVARLLTTEGEVFEMDLLFIPQVQPLREHDGFMDLMESLGLSEYWYERGCVWSPVRIDCGAA